MEKPKWIRENFCNEKTGKVDWNVVGGYWLLGCMSIAMVTLTAQTIYEGHQSFKQRKIDPVPSKLEISIENVDGHGKDTLLTNYRGKTYMMIFDERGNLRTQKYEKGE
jgi:hypothetical protein